MPRTVFSPGSRTSSDPSAGSLWCRYRTPTTAEAHPSDTRGTANLALLPVSESRAGPQRRDHSCPSPRAPVPCGVRTWPGWAGSPAAAPGRCRCPGSSSSPEQGIWKWFAEAPGKERRRSLTPPPPAAVCTAQSPPFSTALRLDLHQISHREMDSFYGNYRTQSSQLLEGIA